MLDWEHLGVTVRSGCRVRCESTWRLDEAWSQNLRDYDLWLVWAGRGRMELRSGGIDLLPGTCLWMRPGGRYLAEHDPRNPLGVNAIHFDLPGVEPGELPPEVHQVWDLAFWEMATTRIIEARHDRGPLRLAAARWLTGLLIELDVRRPSPAGRGTDRHYHELVQPIAARMRERPAHFPRIAQLAREVGYSADHFGRVFHRVMGVGPEDYLIQCRISRAKQLLAETSLTVQQVATALGYADVYFFSRQFKQHTGRPPTGYRQAL